MIFKYNLSLVKWQYVGDDEDGPVYEGYDYDVDNYEYEVSKEKIIDLICKWENVEHKEIVEDNFDKLFDDWYGYLYDEFQPQAQEEAQQLVDEGEL